MPTFEYDRRYVEHGLELLESYLLADAAYWPVSIQPPPGEPAYPMLTLESVRLALLRLSAHRGLLAYEHQSTKLSLELETLHRHWTVAWEKKAHRALHARLTMWSNYLAEYNELPEGHADRYVYEVRLRVFIAILIQDCGIIDTQSQAHLLELDDFLKAVLVPGNFIWDDDIHAG